MDLEKEYLRVLEENKKLKEEITLLKKHLGIEEVDAFINEYSNSPYFEKNFEQKEAKTAPKVENEYQISKHSSEEDKIALYMSLFRGREDVSAKQWINKDGKPGYSPYCRNDWVKGKCLKPNIKCSNCLNQKFVPLSSYEINKHLRGVQVIGIYPLLTDDHCYFLAMDFDKASWQEDLSIVRGVCKHNNISAHAERSRSGNGAHLWFFFEDKIRASLARKFGSLILTEAMNLRHEISFKSYDRLFPSQDYLQKDGYGNLIALPLQGKARKNHNTEFIDENLSTYEDQWFYLSAIEKIPEDFVQQYISSHNKNSELGTLIINEDEKEKPWEKRMEKEQFTIDDFPPCVQMVKANGIYIEKEGLSQRVLNRIKRLAAFSNPEFYLKQSMRMSTHNIERIISTANETEEHICLPRGCEPELLKLFETYGIKHDFLDNMNHGRDIDVSFKGELRIQQDEALKQLLLHENGVLSATTGFGKTVISAKIIAERCVNTLVLVNSQQLMQLWKRQLEEFLEINDNLVENITTKKGHKKKKSIIGQLGVGKNQLNGIIDIVIMQSLFNEKEVKELVKDYGMVIVDECHHVSATSFEQVLKAVNAHFVYGLSATPIRKDGHHPIIFMQCGPIRYRVDAKEQAIERPFEHYIIPRFTPFRKPIYQEEKEWHISEIYRLICESEIRNQMLINDITASIFSGRTPIVLTERTEHVNLLSKLLVEKKVNVITLTGKMSVRERREEYARISEIPKGQSFVIVATGKLIGEGFDEPRLDTLFLAMPVAWKGTIQQYAGRLHRLYEGKNEVQVYDYVDVHIGVLERMYHKRLRGYASIGYKVKTENQKSETPNILFNQQDYYSTFITDINSAAKSIIIVCPILNKRKVKQLVPILKETYNKGIRVTIITRNADAYIEKDKYLIKEIIEELSRSGIDLLMKNDCYQKFAIIDNNIIWYGSLSLLGYNKEEDNIMRIESIEIANEFLGIVENMDSNIEAI